MNYVPPGTIISPQDYISNLRVIYDGGDASFSLAMLDWDGDPGYAMRWNVSRREWDDPEKSAGRKKCVGMPSSHGHPVWFVLPNELIERNSVIWKLIDDAKNV